MTQEQLCFADAWMSLFEYDPAVIADQLWLKREYLSDKSLGIEGFTLEESKEIWDYVQEYITYKGD